jgi:hypothetical protein
VEDEMGAYLTKEQELESRIANLEATVNKSNFSAGLVLSLENIKNNIAELRHQLRLDDIETTMTQATRVALNVVGTAITKEMIRLEGKN